MSAHLSLIEPLTICHAISVLVPASYGGPEYYGVLKEQTARILEKRLQPYGVTLEPGDIVWSEVAYDHPYRTGISGHFEGTWAGVRGVPAEYEGGPNDRRGFQPRRDRRGIPRLVHNAGPGGGAPRVEYRRQGIRPETGAWVYRYAPVLP